LPDIDWLSAASAEETIDILSTQDIDAVLLDLWLRREDDSAKAPDPLAGGTIAHGDYVPLSARALDEGREVLSKIHERFPATPVYLLSFIERDDKTEDDLPEATCGVTATISIDPAHDDSQDAIVGEPRRKPIDDELMLACVRSGGARGLIATDFTGAVESGWKARRDKFAEALLGTLRRLYREKMAQVLARERKILTFETAAVLDEHERQLRIRLRNFQLGRAIDALDAGEMVDDVQRPNTRFDDVLGANAAKEALNFVVDYDCGSQDRLPGRRDGVLRLAGRARLVA
jgi:hypothetical protein